MVDLDAATNFVLTHGRLLERQRLDTLLHDSRPTGVLASLAGYQNADGGFGQALEPDVRAPHSETIATLTALELLAEYGAESGSAAARALAWVGTVAGADGGIPFMLPASNSFPHAPWMQPADDASHLTFGFAAMAHRAGCQEPWVQSALDWCWDQLSDPGLITGYALKYALAFLDSQPADPRTEAALTAAQGLVGEDGCVPVPGGTADEKLTPLALSPRPDRASRSLFSPEQIRADVDRLAHHQAADGGWTFDWLEWCPAQGLDWRGIQTVQALQTLREHAHPSL